VLPSEANVMTLEEVSTRKTADITEALCGMLFSRSMVSSYWKETGSTCSSMRCSVIAAEIDLGRRLVTAAGRFALSTISVISESYHTNLQELEMISCEDRIRMRSFAPIFSIFVKKEGYFLDFNDLF